MVWSKWCFSYDTANSNVEPRSPWLNWSIINYDVIIMIKLKYIVRNSQLVYTLEFMRIFHLLKNFHNILQIGPPVLALPPNDNAICRCSCSRRALPLGGRARAQQSRLFTLTSFIHVTTAWKKINNLLKVQDIFLALSYSYCWHSTWQGNCVLFHYSFN